MSDADMQGMTGLLEELGLPADKDTAQKLIDFESARQLGKLTAANTEYEDMVGRWTDQSRSDTEFGGETFDANVAIAQDALKSFGNEALVELLESNGLGNHPEVVRLLWKVGKLTQEDRPGRDFDRGQADQTAEEILYKD